MASHFEGDDDFEEYDPDPYEGGYDIALTYGRPLSPSPSTCYPLSPDSDHRPQPPPPSPPKESGHHPEPHGPLPPTLPPEPDHRNSYDYGESCHCPEGYWPDLDVFGFWPFASACESLRSGAANGADVEEVGYWNQWKRAGDYLFGDSQGYGERRIGVDSYGIPIYANKKERSQPVTLQIEPARDLKVDCYESDSWFSSYDEKDKGYGYAYNKHHPQEPLHVEEDLTEPMLHQRVAYHEAYEDQVYPKLEWWFSSADEDKSYGYAYNKHHCQEPLHVVEENLTEPMLHQRLSYHEAYEDQVHSKLEWQRCQHEYGDENSFYSNDQYGYERQYSEQPLCVELEPYKPTWSQNLNYQEFYNGEVSLESNCQSLVDYGVERNFSGSLNDAYGRHFHEQPLCVQLEPFKPAWAQNPTFYEPYMQEVPQSSLEAWDGKDTGTRRERNGLVVCISTSTALDYYIGW